MAQDLKGESKGYGFVHYEKDESARLAIEKVNGMLLEGKKVNLALFYFAFYLSTLRQCSVVLGLACEVVGCWAAAAARRRHRSVLLA